MALILYEHPLSPYAQKVKIALREKGLDVELRLPVGIGTGAAAEDFQAASPFGEVPVLIDDGYAIFDSTIILEYIEQKWPKPDLLPENPALAATARMIEEVVDTRFEAINWAVSEITNFRRAEGPKASELLAEAARQTAGLHAWLERHLNPDRRWFGPTHFGWADLCVLPYVAAAAGTGRAPPSGSRLAAWLEHCLERPTVQQTLAEAREAAGVMRDVGAAVKAGLFRRQYRDHRLEWMMRSGGVGIVLDGLKANTIRFTPDLN